MNLRKAVLVLMVEGVAVAIAAVVAISCQQDIPGSGITLAGDAGAGQPTPTGALVPIQINAGGAPAGVTVTLAAEPASIAVSPASVTTDQSGNAEVFALVPFGTNGVVTALATGSAAAEIKVAAAPLSLCGLSASPLDAGAGPVGQVNSVSVAVGYDGGCSSDGKALADPSSVAMPGVTVTFSLGSLSTSTPSPSSDAATAAAQPASATTAVTDAYGNATANIVVPWGANALIQAAAGGTLVESPLSGIENPIRLTCVQWVQQPSNSALYTVTAQTSDGTQAVGGVPVTFAAVSPNAMVGTFTPTVAVSDGSGDASTVFAITGDAGAAPVAFAAMVGTTVLVANIGAAGGSGQSGPNGGACE